ncbi:MAG TPA: hypothetical protein VHT75_13105 [Acidimicrobiales bacterium]|jgi:hypothetical protein|nr:hypothetical protein [Acidimicrobiales bacterium]
MFKRLFWLLVGASLGFGGSWWVTRTVKQKLERLMPARVSAGVARAAQHGPARIKEAVADGRLAMRQREAELQARLDARYPPRPPAATGETPTSGGTARR